MGKLKNKLFYFLTKNIWLTFILNTKSVIDFLIWIKDMIQLNINFSQALETFPLGYNEFMLFLISLITYSVFRYLIRGINDISKTITNNLNDSNRILDNKIRYVDLKVENVNVSNDLFVKKLIDNGFSKEELEEIGVNDDFINNNKDKLLPKKIIEHINALKEYYNNQ
ncbi:MAG: hypothetical protein LC122_00270 [Chitinophagales bacterium]|nr:hypothetical protein [Chitinophagales bacterium]